MLFTGSFAIPFLLKFRLNLSFNWGLTFYLQAPIVSFLSLPYRAARRKGNLGCRPLPEKVRGVWGRNSRKKEGERGKKICGARRSRRFTDFSVSKSLAEFRRPEAAEENQIVFPAACTSEKHFARSERRIVRHRRTTEAQSGARPLEKASAFFDSLKSAGPSGPADLG